MLSVKGADEWLGGYQAERRLLNNWEDNRWPGGAECPGGYQEPRGHPRGQEGVKQPGGRRGTRMAVNSK